MTKIEYLFPEVTNLYGETFNVNFLKNSIEDVEVIETSLTDEPSFITQDIDLIYMGSMSEKVQEIVIEKLRPYTDKIKELIEENKVFILTGNALEVFTNYIEDDEKGKIQGLGIIDVYAKRYMQNRYNTLFLGELDVKEKIKIVGFKATFSFCYGENANNYAFKAIKGCGINKDSNLEGIRKNNFFGTYLMGPVLIENPYFTKYIIELLGVENSKLQFEKEVIDCYNKKLERFESDNVEYLQ